MLAEDVERPIRQRGGATFPSGLVLQLGDGPTGDHEDHWDPHNTGLPLLATGPATHGERVSPHFTVREMVSSGGVASPLARISPQLVRVLEAIRVRAGKPVRITSGYRSWRRNQDIYRARGQRPTLSRHCSGQAVDFKIAGMNGVELAKLAIDAAGTNLAIGLGSDFIHVDVRGTWTLWEYSKNAGGKAAMAEVTQHRAAVLKGRAPTPAPPKPTPPSPAPSQSNRLVVEHHPLLKGHRGTAPDLVLRWANVDAPGAVDVVVHFHGYSDHKAGMRLPTHKESISGLDFGSVSRPILGILPRGSYAGDRPGRNPDSYDFPALIKPGALDALIDDALARLGRQTGHDLRRGRLILTAHSGGGATLLRALAHNDPDEIHVFDALYQSGAALVDWARKRIARQVASPAPVRPALRVLYRAGTKAKPGTMPHSETVARGLCSLLTSNEASGLAPFFRVDMTPVGHNDIPREYGGTLLGNAGQTLPRTTTFSCPSRTSREAEWGEDPETESLAWLDVENNGLDEALEYEEVGEQLWEAEGEIEPEGEEVEAEYDTAYEAEEEEYEVKDEDPESFEPETLEDLEPETLEDSESVSHLDTLTDEADFLAANDEALDDAFADFEEEAPPKDKVDDFLASRRSLYKVSLVGENLHINLARDAWTKAYTARALTEGGVGAALNAIYMGGVTAARVEKVFAQLAGTGVKYTPEKRMAKGEGAVHAIIVTPAALDGLARALNLTRKDMVEAWRLRFGETAFLEFALRSAFGSFHQLVPHFSAKALAAKRMTVELIKRLIDKHPGSVIEVAKRHPAAAAWRAAFKRNLALHWAERDPQITDLDKWTWAQWAKAIFELTTTTRDTLNAQILRQREEDRKHARNEHLRPHEIAVDDAAKFILENYEPTHQEKLHTTFWIVHGGLHLTNIKGEPIFLLRVDSSKVIYQHLPTKKFYQQTLEGFGDEQLYGIYAEAGRKSQGAIALTKWVIGLAGAVFPVVRYGLMATDVLNAAFKLKKNQAALESSYESIKLAYGNIDKLLPGVLPKIWDAVLDKRNAALFNPLQNPDPGAWLKVVIRLVMMRQARVVSGSYASEAVTGFLNKAWKAIKTGLSALWEVIKHVIVLGPAVVGSTGVSGERALNMAEERLKKLGVADAAAIVLQVRRLSKADLERLSREVKDLVDNSTKLIDVVRDSLSW
ncbi:YcbK family protein [Dongia deserti]|uniref:YcbK family protein n=1 Tax=Dongia deserti TaxID=2268030 RepID=UPI0025487979|nr:D-Ala-D-Ala carboxypeptidase family metallohydrolase [Dongia deserti]